MNRRPFEAVAQLDESLENFWRLFTPMKSCQHMAAVAIVGPMWIRPRQSWQFSTMKIFIGEVMHEIERDISKLDLPVTSKAMLLDIVKSMAQEIRKWNDVMICCGIFDENEYKYDYEYENCKFLKCLVWTSIGRIDYQETARKMKDDYPGSWCEIHSRNPVSPYYPWNQINRSSLKVAFKKKHLYMQRFILSHLYGLQPKKKLKDEYISNRLLSYMLRDWLCFENFIPSFLQLRDIGIPVKFDYFIYEVANIIHNLKSCKHQYYCILKELWQLTPLDLKIDIIRDVREFTSHCLFAILETENVELIKLILADVPTEQKKEIMGLDITISKCEYWLLQGHWSKINVLINEMCKTHDNLERFIDVKGWNVCACLVKESKWNEIQKFLKTFFKSDEERNHFKCRLLNNTNMFRHLIYVYYIDFADERKDLTKLMEFGEKFFTSKDQIEKFKSLLSTQLSLDSRMNLLIKNMENVEELLGWCFKNSRKTFVEFKKDVHKNFKAGTM